MATGQELFEALGKFAQRFNENKIVQKMVRGWDRHIFISVTDLDLSFTIVVANNRFENLVPGETEKKTHQHFCRVGYHHRYVHRQVKPGQGIRQGECQVHRLPQGRNESGRHYPVHVELKVCLP